MTLEILKRKLFLKSASELTFVEYFSIIIFSTTFYTFNLKLYIFQMEIFSGFQ